MPNIQEVLSMVHSTKVFTTIDAFSGRHPDPCQRLGGKGPTLIHRSCGFQGKWSYGPAGQVRV